MTKKGTAFLHFSIPEGEFANLPHTKAEKLPIPKFIKNSETSNLLATSVFKNPFTEAENAKKAVLEKHVKMVGTKDNTNMINGKRICWNYRKGKCRFGHNCKYAHDSDLQKSKEELDSENQIQQIVLCQSQNLPQPTTHELREMQESVSSNKKRKHHGLVNGLVPGKKIMNQYRKNKK